MTEAAIPAIDYGGLKSRYHEAGVSATMTETSSYTADQLRLKLDSSKAETLLVPIGVDDLDQIVLNFDPNQDSFAILGHAEAGGPSTPHFRIESEYATGSELYVYETPRVSIGTGSIDEFGFPSSFITVALAPSAWESLMQERDGDRPAALADLRTLLDQKTPGLAEWSDFPAIEPNIDRPQNDSPHII